ncbi:MAG: T9SS C-terminal target domain-containing protein, partial [Bacteroidetes bacterium]
DTLRGVSIHFPHTGAASEDQRFRLKVWVGSLNTEPVYEGDYQPYFTTSFYDTLQGFTTYPLEDFRGNKVSVPIPAGDFFIGWEQLTNCIFSECIGIGYDRNRPAARDYIFREGNTGWEPIVGISRGALMIRPIFGSDEVLPTATTEPAVQATPLRIYPNPARDVLYFAGWQSLSTHTSVSLYTAAGQQLLARPLGPQLELPPLASGLYFLRFQDPEQGRIWVEKVIIQ